MGSSHIGKKWGSTIDPLSTKETKKEKSPDKDGVLIMKTSQIHHKEPFLVV